MRSFVMVVLFAVFGTAQGRPNLLWISSEDNGPDLGCYGCPDADTPQLDALAAEGVLFTRCWSNAPVCSTARTTIITGMYPQRLGAEHHRSRSRIPDGIKLFPQLLREAGYWCSNHSKTDYNLSGTGKAWDESSNRAHWRGRAKGQPFFAVFNLGVSHESQTRKRPHEFVHDPAVVHIPPQHPDVPEVREAWAQYHDQLSEMDRQAGEILAQLDADGLAEDTIVFYWGDHGAGLPGFKRNPKNQGMHVPMIVRVPEKWRDLAGGIATGSSSDRLIAFVDLGATVLSLAGLPTPEWMDGRAFLGRHRGEAKTMLLGYRGRMDERDDLVRTLFDGRYVYVRNFMPWLPLGQHVDYMFETPMTVAWKSEFDAGRLNEVQSAFWRPRAQEELYDLESDPEEATDLAASEEHEAILSRMREQLRARLAELGDLSFVPESLMADLSPDGLPWLLTHGEAGFGPAKRWLDIAWRASLGDIAEEQSLATAARSDDPVARAWAFRGLAHLGAGIVAKHRERFTSALDDPQPAIRVIAAEALLRGADDPLARARLVELADRHTAGFFVALAAWNAIDRLDAKMAPSRTALLAIDAKVDDVPAPMRNYLPRIRAKALADI